MNHSPCDSLPSHFAVFLPDLSGGGAERAMLNIADGLARRAHQVDLVLCRATGAYLDHVPAAVRIVELRERSHWLGRACAAAADLKGFPSFLLPIILARKFPLTVRCLPDLVQYLRREKPTALLSAMTYTNLTAVWGRRQAGISARVIVSEQNHLSSRIRNRRRWRSRFVTPLVRRTSPQADAIVAISDGVADDLSRLARLPRKRIMTIYNPVVTSALHTQARAPLDHPWFRPDASPVVLGIGRLHRQKDFPTLLSAFARVRAQRPVRLVILGEGKLRTELETIARTLGIAADVAMPGFVENPYAYLARAAVFALSSAWEGLANVLIEALACGCPVVSTDCPSGPAEILDGGKYGRLVPVGDDAELAQAICDTLDHAPPREKLIERGQFFSVDRSVEQYERLLLGTDPAPRQRR